MKRFGKLACVPGLLSLAVHAAAELPIGLSLDGTDRVGRHEKIEFKLRTPQSAWWNLLVAKTKPAAVKNDSFTLDELTPGAYRIEWWDTETGKIIGERTAASEGGKLQMAIPDFESDIVCKIIRR